MYALQNADAVTTNSSELAKKARAFFDREVILIPNGVDTQLFKPMEKNMVLAEALGLPDEDDGKSDTPVIGFVGELREKKGIRSLLAGYAQANQDRPATLLIVGEVRAGEDKKFFDDFRLSNPQARIIVTGQVPHTDLPGYYALIDIFVHPSLRDGLPNALLEAMACERPVIVTPVGGMMDVVSHGKNGLLVSVNDANSLAIAIGKLLSNPEKRIELGRSARELVASKFGIEKELNANLAVYQGIGISG
jgi:glycosyltransferase involved in cell wall biosynthesis